VVDVTGTDRGKERRRYLDAVRAGDEAESNPEAVDAEDRPEPATDGGMVAVDAPRLRCSSCDRTDSTVPERCDRCGAETFVEPSRFASPDAE
jgi:hypothetical protein